MFNIFNWLKLRFTKKEIIDEEVEMEELRERLKKIREEKERLNLLK